MTQPVDVRTLHFRHPNAEGTETDNHAVRIQYGDIATVKQALGDLQTGGGDTSVQLRYMDLTSTVKKDNYSIPALGVAQVIELMDELSVVDGVAAV